MLMIKQILKNLCLTGLLTLSIACSNKPAELEVEQTTFDLGDVRFRDGVHHISTSLKNIGDSTIHIRKILSDCPCTTGETDKKTYPKGTKGIIKIQMDLSSFFPDSITKKVRIYTDSPIREYEEITIKCKLLSN